MAYFRAGNRRSMLLSHPDDIERVLVTENRRFKKNFALQLLRPLLGNGLLLNEREAWLRQRRLVQPAFSKQRVESYVPAMAELTERMLATWQVGQPRDLRSDMVQLTMAIAGKTLLDVDVGSRFDELRLCIEATMQDFLSRFGHPIPLPLWLPTPLNLRLKRTVRRLDVILQALIDERRSSGTDRGDFLSILLAARDEDDGRGMTDRQVRDEVMTMFLAGHETTANALAWTWHLLGRHPRVQEQLQAEICEVLGNRPPTAADLPRLTLCEHVIREAMRLYPPAYIVGRSALEDCEVGGHFIPARTNVLMSPWVVHRDERWFTQPHEFRPERWTSGMLATLPKYAYFPFGGGPRVCIGNGFAMSESVLVLAMVLQRFSLTSVDSQPNPPLAAVTLRPSLPVMMTLK